MNDNWRVDVYYDGSLVVSKTDRGYFFCCYGDYGFISQTIGDYLLKRLNDSWQEGYATLDRIIKLFK